MMDRDGLFTHRLLANDEFLHLLYLGDVVFVSFKLSFPNSLIDAHQHLSWDVLSVIHTCAQEAKNKKKPMYNYGSQKIYGNPRREFEMQAKHIWITTWPHLHIEVKGESLFALLQLLRKVVTRKMSLLSQRGH